MYPNQLYLAEVNGRYQFYKEDPMMAADREAARIDLGELLVGYIGHCDIGNPAVLKVRVGRMDRCHAFQASAPEKIRRGIMAAHLEDFDGCYVEMMPGGSGLFEYPFLGAVIGKDGTPVGFRRYSVHGECEDGEENHRVVIIDTPLQVEVPKDVPEKAAPKEEPAKSDHDVKNDHGEDGGDGDGKAKSAAKGKGEKGSRRGGILRRGAKKEADLEEVDLFADSDIEEPVPMPVDED